MKLKEKLILLRKRNGLSQMKLSERLGVSRQTISKWEVGAAMPSADNLKYLSELYDVSIDYLLDDSCESFQQEEKMSVDLETENSEIASADEAGVESEGKPNEKSSKMRILKKRLSRKGIAVILFVLFEVFIVSVLAVLVYIDIKGKEEEITPIDKIQHDTWDNTDVDIFSLDW